ncbi:MAG: hypothetical protein M5U28_37375 [Sandaracinaceae bacterium]|nr:hypothetical protein [Sandaracinaceae bacterium]
MPGALGHAPAAATRKLPSSSWMATDGTGLEEITPAAFKAARG